MLKWVKRIVDNQNADSVSGKMRHARTQLFLDRLEVFPQPVSVLDAGGTLDYWRVTGGECLANMDLTLLNQTLPESPPDLPGVSHVTGDATDMHAYADNTFDAVFSNSVIEHVGDFEAQQRMAKEVQRVGRGYFVQTPNYWFPIEPHFLFPGFQWLPICFRVWLVRHFNLGWIKRIPDPQKARNLVVTTRLLTRKELCELFPKARIVPETWFGLTKSFMVLGGELNREEAP